MSWQAAGTRFKASAWNDTTSYSTSVVLPVDTLVVEPMPYRPEGSTQQELYDGRVKYLEETYGIKMSIEYQFERTNFRPSIYDTMSDLIGLYHSYNYVDFFVQYDGSYTNDSTTPGVITDYKCPKMVPDVTGDVGKIEFQDQARVKQRSLELRSTFSDKDFADINWILD
jgi:hypothetical protein